MLSASSVTVSRRVKFSTAGPVMMRKLRGVNNPASQQHNPADLTLCILSIFLQAEKKFKRCCARLQNCEKVDEAFVCVLGWRAQFRVTQGGPTVQPALASCNPENVTYTNDLNLSSCALLVFISM
jgi:hypothetical protein